MGGGGGEAARTVDGRAYSGLSGCEAGVGRLAPATAEIDFHGLHVACVARRRSLSSFSLLLYAMIAACVRSCTVHVRTCAPVRVRVTCDVVHPTE
jgi:hypothetical protein